MLQRADVAERVAGIRRRDGHGDDDFIALLSAVEGLKVVNPSLEDLIIPVTAVIIVALTDDDDFTTRDDDSTAIRGGSSSNGTGGRPGGHRSRLPRGHG